MTEVINKIVDNAFRTMAVEANAGNLNIRSIIFQAVSAGMKDAYDRGAVDSREATAQRFMNKIITRFDKKGVNKFSEMESELIYEAFLMNPEACMEQMKEICTRVDPKIIGKMTKMLIEY